MRKFCDFYSPENCYFSRANALFRSTVHDSTFQGTQSDDAHWVGEFGPVPGARVVKANVYVLSTHHEGTRHPGTRSRHNAHSERPVLVDIIYQKEWKPGVKHIWYNFCNRHWSIAPSRNITTWNPSWWKPIRCFANPIQGGSKNARSQKFSRSPSSSLCGCIGFNREMGVLSGCAREAPRKPFFGVEKLLP